MIVVFISINDVERESYLKSSYHLDYDNLKIGLDSLDWSPVYSLLNASEAFDRFHYQWNNKQH